MVIGFVIGFTGAMLAIPQATRTILAAISGFAVGVMAGIYVMRSVLQKDFGKFRIRLVATGT
jgi:hypothetical protein